ncbi:MAG: YbjN domain-containing protein [Oscillospiraceae bacterium]|nr:YbjN domain-containing protein [Oscillospiraceae bacterium]
MDYKKVIKLIEEKLTEMNFDDFTVEIDDANNSLFMIPVHIDNISEPDFDMGVLISENGSIFFECQLASEVQKSKRIAMLEMLNHLNFKYHISFVLDENDDVYLKYICITCGDEITVCEQIFIILNYLMNIISICIDDIMCII